MDNAETKRQAITAIQIIAGTFNKDIVDMFFAKVDKVTAVERTCDVTPITGKADTSVTDVSLMTEVSDGELKIPKVGSTVLVAISKDLTPFVFLWSDIDSITWKGGNFDGLVKVLDLTAKLNNLENKMNTVITSYNSHTHAGVTVGSGATAVPAPPIVGTLTPTQKSDIENPLIKHGNK